MFSTGELSSEAVCSVPSDRAARAFVWSVWLIMMLAAFMALIKHGWIFPLNEDWWLVPALTGNEPSLVQWLWSLNNEHRNPLSRLILLALLRTTHGDFRAGMFFNITILVVLAAAMICIARKVRGGRTNFWDALFPIVLLNLGNSVDFLWSWALTFVVPTVLICVMLLVVISTQSLASPASAVWGAATLVLLPLSGSHALLFTPFLSLWFGYYGIMHWRATKAKENRRWTSGLLIVSAVVALCLTGLHVAAYQRPSWRTADPTIAAALETAIKFLALAFGPAARSSWTLSIAAITIILAASAIVVVLAVLRSTPQERHRALGILIFFGNVIVLALAMGWGRATAIESMYGGQYPLWYALVAAPALFLVFFIWELYGPTKARAAVQGGLLLTMLLMLPFNTIQGFDWIKWFPGQEKSLQADLMSGMPPSLFAERYQKLLLHWREPSELKNYLLMLRKARIEPFAKMAEDRIKPEDPTASLTFKQAQHPQLLPSVDDSTRMTQESRATLALASQEIRYINTEAQEVLLVWGLNGWHVAPDDLRPVGTELRRGADENKLMHTPMIKSGDTFIAKVSVPVGALLNYGFLIMKAQGLFDIHYRIWDGDYRARPLEDSVVKTKSSVKLFHNSSDILDNRLYFSVGIAGFLASWLSMYILLPLIDG